jgi:serine O-acetyltransferase
MIELLKKDLERWYFYEGQPQKKASALAVTKAIFSPRFAPVFLCRMAHALYKAGLTPLAKFASLLNFVIFGLEVTIRCEIGPGLVFPHTSGTVIGSVKIGSNALIYHNVTLGAQKMDVRLDPKTRPVIGDNVTIGAGAKVLGGIFVGNNAVIGANAVVTKSVPEGATMLGIPARPAKTSSPY